MQDKGFQKGIGLRVQDIHDSTQDTDAETQQPGSFLRSLDQTLDLLVLTRE